MVFTGVPQISCLESCRRSLKPRSGLQRAAVWLRPAGNCAEFITSWVSMKKWARLLVPGAARNGKAVVFYKLNIVAVPPGRFVPAAFSVRRILPAGVQIGGKICYTEYV